MQDEKCPGPRTASSRRKRENRIYAFLSSSFFFFFFRADGEMERLEGISEVFLEIKIRKGKR